MHWEHRATPMWVITALAAVATLPLVLSLLGRNPPGSPGLVQLLDEHRYREVTGYTALALVLAASALGLRRFPWLGSRRRLAVHIAIGCALLPVILLHTGGRWGSHLNGWLLGSFLLALFSALMGKLAENQRIVDPEAHARAASRLRSLWLPAHLLAVTALVVLLGFHIISTYCF